MAHFAQIDDDGIVVRVVVVGNDCCGEDEESGGIEFLGRIFGPGLKWVRTSYNGNIRKNFAGVGYTYDAARDAFISPQPGPEWVLNEETCVWENPDAEDVETMPPETETT